MPYFKIRFWLQGKNKKSNIVFNVAHEESHLRPVGCIDWPWKTLWAFVRERIFFIEKALETNNNEDANENFYRA